jgi:hypothetical protein
LERRRVDHGHVGRGLADGQSGICGDNAELHLGPICGGYVTNVSE